jgi:hypothetical protein
MTDDIDTIEKKFKLRKRKFKKVLENEYEKEEFFETIVASVEIFLPTKNPEKENDSIILYTNADGKIVDGEYSYQEGEELPVALPLADEDLQLFKEVFIDFRFE